MVPQSERLRWLVLRWASGTHLVLQEQGSELALGPEVHGVGQEFGGNRVDAKEVADKHHALNFLTRTQTQ